MAAEAAAKPLPEPTRPFASGEALRQDLLEILAANAPGVVRWAGAIARQLRGRDIGLDGKKSGVATTDALTLADLVLQELLVAALRDMGPTVRACRLEAEESSGDLRAFATDGDVIIGLDPIDGTLMYRDQTGNGYAVMLHVRTPDTILYSLVYLPEAAPDGLWLEVRDRRIVLGPDDARQTARAVLDALPPLTASSRSQSRRVVVSDLFAGDDAVTRGVIAAGFEPVLGARLLDSVFTVLARGDVAGVITDTPNVYDFPVAAHIARLLGGDAVWAGTGRPIDFRTIWYDERSHALRLPGIIIYAADRRVVQRLVGIARDWNSRRP